MQEQIRRVQPRYIPKRCLRVGVRSFGAIGALFVVVERWVSTIADTRAFLGGPGSKDGDTRDSDEFAVVSDTDNNCFEAEKRVVGEIWLSEERCLLESWGDPCAWRGHLHCSRFSSASLDLSQRHKTPQNAHTIAPKDSRSYGCPFRSFAPVWDHDRRTIYTQLREHGPY